MPDVNADVGRLASALGLGALPYRSFRNAPVRSASGLPPAKVGPVAMAPASTAALDVPRAVCAAPAPHALPPPEAAPASAPTRPTPPSRPMPPAFALLDRVVGQPIAIVALVPSASRPGLAALADFPLVRKALGARGSS